MTTEKSRRRLPVGIQSFEKIRKEGYLYVDKTDIVWNLANNGSTYNYLSRPRRFGKSLLVDTLQAYFEGKRELFDGLRVMEMEKEWVRRPVIRLDMSRAGATAEEICSYLNRAFGRYEKKYGVKSEPGDTLANRFDGIIEAAFEQTGQQVAILVDEYDSPLLHSWKTPHHEECTAVYRKVFAILKADDEYEKFVLITGITKFTQISLFSVLNNLTNISFFPQYAALCGITKQEITDNFMPEIEAMGKACGWTPDETAARLKDNYDGYHFSADNMVDVFNPFSLVNALDERKIKNYWASSGATSMLSKFVDNMEIRLKDFEHCALLSAVIETSDVTGGGAELFLYQSGYLTIKGCSDAVYFLGLPNQEVRQTLNEIVLPDLAMRDSGDIQSTEAFLRESLVNGNLSEAKKCLKALIADVPYSNKKLASMDMEERYRLIIGTIFNAIGFRVDVEKMISTGRIDMVVYTRSVIYVLELKLTNNGGLGAAERQIKANRYTQPFMADRRKVVALAVELDDSGNGLVDWKEVTE